MNPERIQKTFFLGLAIVGAGFALVHFLKAQNPAHATPLTGRAIKPMPLPKAGPLPRRGGAICVRPENFPASLAEGCIPDPCTFLKEVEEHMAAGKPLTRLYLLETPEGPVRLGVILNYEGQKQVGFMTIGKGIGLLMDGAARDVKDAFAQGLRFIGEKHGLGLRANISAGIAGGCGPINQIVWS